VDLLAKADELKHVIAEETKLKLIDKQLMALIQVSEKSETRTFNFGQAYRIHLGF
jgi:hypothetical protein